MLLPKPQAPSLNPKPKNYTERFVSEGLKLPLDYAAIERILPHRYPFLLVDRITELEPDKRIVGIKNVSFGDRYLSPAFADATAGSPALHGQRVAMPPAILTEAIAQVGAILILSKPENRDRLPLFTGIERVRYRRPVYPGDVVIIEGIVKRLRSRMGVLTGHARVNGEVIAHGEMTFALGSRPST
jgi:3-hydroxyacyl-[acyl-carrier-protein] dehydratase